MKPDCGGAARMLMAILLLADAQPSFAFSLPSVWSREVSRSKLLVSRDSSNTTTIPAPISVSPSQYWDGDDGPWSSFAIQVGHLPQNIRVFPGTASTTTWSISPNGCLAEFGPTCATDRGFTYNSNNSLTWVPSSIYDVDTEVNLGLDESGDVGFDTVTLGWQGSGGPTVSHSIVFSLLGDTYWVGILGLNPRPTNFTTFNSPQPSLMQLLVNNNQIPSLSYGYTAGNQYRHPTMFGSLTLGGYDQDRFVPTNVTFPFNSDQSRDLSVNLQSITTDQGSLSNLLPEGAINIYIDSTVAELWLPESACAAFEHAFGITYDDSIGYYTVNASLHDGLVAKNPNVTFTIGPEMSGGSTVDIVLPYAAFDLNLTFPIVIDPNSTYYFPLKRATNETQYTLGRTFLQEAYLIADYDRQNFTVAPCKWNESATSNQDLIPVLRADQFSNVESSKSDGVSTGTIVGIVVGVVVGIALIALAVFILLRRRRNWERQALAEMAGEGKLSSDINHGDKPFYTYGELGDGEIHEMVAPHKPAAQELDSPYKAVDPKNHGYSEMEGGSYFEVPKTDAHEVQGSTPIYEMPGSNVHELPTPQESMDRK